MRKLLFATLLIALAVGNNIHSPKTVHTHRGTAVIVYDGAQSIPNSWSN